MSLAVLVVEDDGLTRMCYQEILEDEGYQVFAAGDRKSAFKLAAEHRPEILVTDLELPDGSGAELLSSIRSLYPVSAIALTGHRLAPDEVAAAGFSAWLEKPCLVPDLLQTVADAVRHIPARRKA